MLKFYKALNFNLNKREYLQIHKLRTINILFSKH